MSFEDFEQHVRLSSPRFHCTPAGKQADNRTFIAHVRHILNPPAKSDDLQEIDRLLGLCGAEIKQFYSTHNGLTLYEDVLPSYDDGSSAAGIRFFRVDEWSEQSHEMRDWYYSMGLSDDEFSEWMLKGIAFGEVPHSANYFVIGTTGSHAGKIYYADHDDYRDESIAESFTAFLDAIIADPADFMLRHGCCTRYSDGNSETQWIPREFLTE